jgi:hypothetical protein
MIDVLLPGVMLVGIATLIVAVGALRSSRRSEGLGEDRYELLRNQHEQLEILREERQVLVEELKRESRERQHLMKTLEEARPRLVEDVEGVRREHGEAERQAEQQEHERARLQHELKRLEEELERERRGHSEVQQRAEQQEQERLRLEGELERSEAQVEKRIAELEASQKVTPAPEGREAPHTAGSDERGQEPPRARKVPEYYKNEAVWAQFFITAAASMVAVAILVISVSEGRVLVAGLAGGLANLSIVAFLFHLWLFRFGKDRIFRLGRDRNAENEDSR